MEQEGITRRSFLKTGGLAGCMVGTLKIWSSDDVPREERGKPIDKCVGKIVRFKSNASKSGYVWGTLALSFSNPRTSFYLGALFGKSASFVHMDWRGHKNNYIIQNGEIVKAA